MLPDCAMMVLQITGQLPFVPKLHEARPVAPDWVAEEGKKRWEEYEMMLALHRQWVSISIGHGIAFVHLDGCGCVLDDRACNRHPVRCKAQIQCDASFRCVQLVA